MMKRAAFFCILLLLLSSCTGSDKYVDWLYEAMPLPDSLMYPRSYWEANVAKTLQVRKDMKWNVPEREFLHFVLPLRVNNETLDDFRTTYADTLCARVKGMSLSQAALEINHWCHEQACYEPSDGRTSAPMATVRRGVGRCGEESVLTVAALRAAGIPARQVYTPRWAHTDDNHAWVEVFTEDGKWHFMGACEPAPTLDNAWFNAPVSRAMLLHTKVYGNYDGPEDVIRRTPCYTEINVIRGYVPARRTVVTVLDGGSPVQGAKVEFKIYNYAEFYTVASYTTGADGTAALDTGLGDLLVWAQKDGKFGFAKASSESVTVRLEHNIGERFSADIDIVPPPENPIPSGATPEQEEANRQRLAAEDAIRNSHPHRNPDSDSFLEAYGEEGTTVLQSLSDKDWGDVTLDVLEDALPITSDNPDVVSPRVELEHLRPFRKEVRGSGIAGRLHSAREVVQWVRDSISLVEGRNPQGLRTSPVDVWRARKADARGRDIFFVALCRTLGIPARIDQVTGKVQYFQRDLWIDAAFESEVPGNAAPVAIVKLSTPLSSKPEYYRQYTFTRIGQSGSRLMEYEENGPFRLDYVLEKGYYLLTTGTRLQDGSVLAHLEFFELGDEGSYNVPLVLRKQEGKLSVIGTFNADPLLELSGRGDYLLFIPGREGHEPTNHAIHELEASAEALNAWGKPVVVLGSCRLKGLNRAVYGSDKGGAVRKGLSGTGTGGDELPIVALCDSFGRIFYISKGYNTSLKSDLSSVIK
jgi:transglutaminase-like putative cysteine protease